MFHRLVHVWPCHFVIHELLTCFRCKFHQVGCLLCFLQIPQSWIFKNRPVPNGSFDIYSFRVLIASLQNTKTTFYRTQTPFLQNTETLLTEHGITFYRTQTSLFTEHEALFYRTRGPFLQNKRPLLQNTGPLFTEHDATFTEHGHHFLQNTMPLFAEHKPPFHRTRDPFHRTLDPFLQNTKPLFTEHGATFYRTQTTFFNVGSWLVNPPLTNWGGLFNEKFKVNMDWFLGPQLLRRKCKWCPFKNLILKCYLWEWFH